MWKEIPNCDDGYLISSDGEVKSLKRYHKSDSRILRHKPGKYGYRYLTLYKDGHKLTKKIHRLVAEAFLPNPHNKKEVNHIDGDKNNNCLENLEWATSSENKYHCYRIGLRDNHGEGSPAAKLNKFQVKRIRLLYGIIKKPRLKTIAKLFGVCDANISSIIRNKTWEVEFN